MSHTPGPWVIRGKSPLDEYTYVILPTDSRLPKVADVFESDPAVGMADAMLIASAPDLFEAAKHAVMEWRLHGQLTDSCRVLERAIAKAEGKR